MIASIVPNRFVARPMPALAAGAMTVAVALVAISPLGEFLARAFVEGWLAVYMDAGAFRLFCI
ncbi:MAG: hypothetical protein FJ311_11105 [Rhodospirillales bacterium]|nr:hypothetical protein [Rhodospirillales bacterium]